MSGKGVAKLVISIILTIIASLGLYVTVKINNNLGKRVDYLIKNCTETATGEVYTNAKQGVELLFRGNIVGAEFTLDGKQYHAGGLDEGSHNRGDEMICHYNPVRPMECYAGKEPSLINKNLSILIYCLCIITIVGSIVVATLTVIKSIKK